MNPSDREEPAAQARDGAAADRSEAALSSPASASPDASDASAPSDAPSETFTGSGAGDAFETFRLPFYARLWSSNLIQFACFQVLFLAMQWLVTSITPLRSALGLVGFIQGGTIALASPAAGVIVDRQAKRNLIAIGRIGLTAVAMSVGLLAWSGEIAYWHLLVVSVVGGVLSSVLSPATQTFVVDVVGRQRTHHAISLNAVGSSFGTMGGGALGGFLIGTVGVVGTFVSASLGVGLAALLVLTIPIVGRSKHGQGDVTEHPRSSALEDLRQGFRYVRERPPLLLALVACSMAIFNGAISPMRIFFAREVLDVGAEGLGAMAGVHGVGTLVASLWAIVRPPKRHLGLLIAGTMLAYASGLVLYSFAFSFAWVLGVELWLGFTGMMWNITALIGFQLAVPEAMRGRVLSMVFTLAQLGFVGILAVGALADVVGDQRALLIFGAIPTLLLSGLMLFGWKTLRQM